MATSKIKPLCSHIKGRAFQDRINLIGRQRWIAAAGVQHERGYGRSMRCCRRCAKEIRKRVGIRRSVGSKKRRVCAIGRDNARLLANLGYCQRIAGRVKQDRRTSVRGEPLQLSGIDAVGGCLLVEGCADGFGASGIRVTVARAAGRVILIDGDTRSKVKTNEFHQPGIDTGKVRDQQIEIGFQREVSKLKNFERVAQENVVVGATAEYQCAGAVRHIDVHVGYRPGPTTH